MNKREKKRIQQKRKRLRKILLAEIIVALLAVIAAAVFALLPGNQERNSKKDGSRSAAVSTEGKDASSETPESGRKEESTEQSKTEEASTASVTAETDSAETGDSTSAPEDSTEAAVTESEAEASTAQAFSADYSRVVFVGDSRTLSMGTGGDLEFALVPDDSICATWGGQLIDTSAYENASAAARKYRDKTVFWYGINDVQMNPERDNPQVFITNYDRLLSAFLTENDSSTIYLLSILSTSVNERDYYEGQEANIEAYNQALQAYAQEHGYGYLDLRPLYTGEDCFAEGDNIHFSKAWYEERFLPAVTRALGIAD